jgi:hypothetical protein
MRASYLQFDRPLKNRLMAYALLAGLMALQNLCFAQNATPIPSTSTRPAPGAVSTSTTGQFIIHGADLNTRSSFAMLADELSQSLGQLLKDDGKFAIPVVIVVKTPPNVAMIGPAVTASISELEHGGFHLQMNVQLRQDFQSEDYSHELVRVLLAERILRNHQKLENTRQRVLPDWVLTGVIQAMDYRSRSRPSAVFAAVFRSGQIFSIDRILSANPTELDALSRTIFETSTCALILTLLDQPDGALRFSKFLGSLASDSKSDRELLQQFFPNLATSQNSMEKWWTLQMATLATPGALETMSIAETEEKLDEALTLHFEESPEEKAATAKLTAPTDEKKGGLFAKWFKSDPSTKKEEEVKPEPKTEKKSEELKPPTKAEKKAEPSKEQPKVETKPNKKKDSKSEEKPKDDIESTPSDKPSWWNPFGGSRKTIFPFSKKKVDEEEEPAEKKKEEKPADKKKVKPEAKTEKPATDEAKPAVSKLPRKPSSQRSISGKPSDLPDLTQEKSAPKKKVDDAKVDDTSTATGRTLYNPLNWFKRGKSDLENKPEVVKKGTPPPDIAKPKPATARLASYPLEDYLRIWKRKDRSDIMQRSLDQLNALKQRAHPLYKQIVNEYAAVTQLLAQGKDKGVMDKLEDLRAKRAKTREAAKAVESYVDWYEATQNETYSGEFDDYLKLCRKLDKEKYTRGDAISKYLDAIEKEYED